MQKSVEDAQRNWKPFDNDCERGSIKKVEEFVVLRDILPGDDDFVTAESRLGCRLPISYKQLLKRVGSFKIGSFFTLSSPDRLKTRLGDLIAENFNTSELGNFKDGPYNQFIILAEYGTFPSQLDDYSSGAAFNRSNPDEVVIYSCDEAWLSNDPAKRDPALPGRKLLGYIEDCLSRLIERIKEPLAMLEDEIKWYESESPGS